MKPETSKKDSQKHNHSDQPIRCLVIQLSKLTDTLQSLMALRAAKQLYPELEITLAVSDSMVAAAKKIDWISEVLAFPKNEILTPMIEGNKKEGQALREIAKWISPLISQQPWDIVVNWSYSESSSYLTGLIPARIKLGYSRRKDTSFSSVDGWSHYIQAIVQGRIHQNIHLTDILTTQLLTALQIHVGDPADHGNHPVTSKNFFNLDLEKISLGPAWKDHSKKWVALQLGSGDPSKQWKSEAWIKFIQKIVQNNSDWNIALLGCGSNDSELAQSILSEVKSENILTYVGKTDFDVWATIISRCQWLISTDTAAIHLASVLGTRVLNISVGPVKWNETGPYGNGHYVISPNLDCPACLALDTSDHLCKSAITAESVYTIWSHAKDEWHLNKMPSLNESQLTTVRVFKSRIRPADQGGGVVYEPILKRPLTLSDWTSMVMGHVARSWYCGWVPPIGLEIQRDLLSPGLLQKIRELDESSMVLSKICSESILTAVELNQKAATIKSDKLMEIEDRKEIAKLSKKLLHLDQLTERLSQSFPTLSAFSRMSKVLMHNLRGELLSEVSRETIEAYRQLNDGVTILREWIKFTLTISKPKAVALKTEAQP